MPLSASHQLVPQEKTTPSFPSTGHPLAPHPRLPSTLLEVVVPRIFDHTERQVRVAKAIFQRSRNGKMGPREGGEISASTVAIRTRPSNIILERKWWCV
ncbi:hypothetical protein Zmor_014098 [Zophobas morio]|uniref:Uncharacterized protein n=1 Tax=Zophobas morio TaxID=2755281 RepID=A0AA38IGQ2_9CUCU|nr:hypothetical protein Zmor_014098 [Zophobas morio]